MFFLEVKLVFQFGFPESRQFLLQLYDILDSMLFFFGLRSSNFTFRSDSVSNYTHHGLKANSQSNGNGQISTPPPVASKPLNGFG